MYFILEGWVSGLNHLSAKEAILMGPRVRIPPLPQAMMSGTHVLQGQYCKSQWKELSYSKRRVWVRIPSVCNTCLFIYFEQYFFIRC